MKIVIILFLSFICLCETLFAQNSYTIYFKTYEKRSGRYTKQEAGLDLILAIKDSQSYTYYSFKKSKLPVKYPLGSSYIPKSTYFNVSKNLIIDPFGYYKEPKTEALLVYDSPEYNWKITEEKKAILGDSCIKAIGKKNNIEIIAWYSPRLPAGFAIHHYVGLPGTILEIERPDRSIYTVAVRIENSSPDIIEPNYFRRVLGKTYWDKRNRADNPKIEWEEDDFIDKKKVVDF